MDIARISQIGNRSVNEDFVNYIEKDGSICLVLADGLGGHGYGEVASMTAVNAVLYSFIHGCNYSDFLVKSVSYAQEKLKAVQQSDFKLSDMRTTITIVFIHNAFAQWLHVGDSRIYMFRNGKLVSCTSDHSIPGMLVKTGEINFSKIRGHEDRNKLLRVLGQPDEKIKYELSASVELQHGDAFLLCSDGFWECIDEAHMLKRLKIADSAYNWLEQMNKIVQANGAKIKMDNNSALAAIYK